MLAPHNCWVTAPEPVRQISCGLTGVLSDRFLQLLQVDHRWRPTACVIFEDFIPRAKLVKPSLALPLTDDVLPKSIAQLSMRFGRYLAFLNSYSEQYRMPFLRSAISEILKDQKLIAGSNNDHGK
ncbi:hypothetical protein Y032_0239g3326 [Ancylostoma ceylanicum]|uniref:Uncharacterized protein n=1 Tax=Ancylostoma ceylanicum TaxID=53326 RepID=A0A016SEY5_9BILA|nr:hypothetical protein Y032_0239g3326 [Ancylostoma ceylanicum]